MQRKRKKKEQRGKKRGGRQQEKLGKVGERGALLATPNVRGPSKPSITDAKK